MKLHFSSEALEKDTWKRYESVDMAVWSECVDCWVWNRKLIDMHFVREINFFILVRHSRIWNHVVRHWFSIWNYILRKWLQRIWRFIRLPPDSSSKATRLEEWGVVHLDPGYSRSSNEVTYIARGAASGTKDRLYWLKKGTHRRYTISSSLCQRHLTQIERVSLPPVIRRTREA